MPQRQTQPEAQTRRGEGEAAPLASTSLRVVDYCGRRRRGSAVILPRRSLGLISAKLEEGEDFRIIMLAEPPDGPVSPAEGAAAGCPPTPPPLGPLRDPRALIERAGGAGRGAPPPGLGAPASRLSQLASAGDAETLL